MPRRYKYFIITLVSVCGLLLVGIWFSYDVPSTPFIAAAVKVQAQVEPTEVASTTQVRIPILIYHSVHPMQPHETASQKEFNVPPEVFESQLRYLAENGYTTISMAQLVEAAKVGTTTPIKKPIVLTFDDGWQDQYKTAFPLLLKYHDTATFYIYTNPLGKDVRFVTWDEVLEMSQAGMTIASHSLTHPYLSKLSEVQLHKELFDSKKILESHIGKPVVDFASPFGFTNEHIQELLAEAGYTTGRTTLQGSEVSQAGLLHLRGYFTPSTQKDFEWIVSRSK